MYTYSCQIAQPGIFAGVAKHLDKKEANGHSAFVFYDCSEGVAAFDRAVSALKAELRAGSLGQSSAGIMEATAEILDDPSFTGEIREAILNGVSVETAIEQKTDAVVGALQSSGSDYLVNRCADIKGLAMRLTDLINGDGATASPLSGQSAIFANEISPLLLSGLPAGAIGALVSDKGSANSHAAIIAGNLGVPYLYGAGEAIATIEDGFPVIVDGDRGILTVDPDEETYQAALSEMKARTAKRKQSSAQEAKTVSCKTKIYANIAGPGDIEKLLQSGADGVGLFRTEFLFLNSDTEPTEEEQLAAYGSVLEAMGSKEVIIRTMDIGSDKTVRWLNLPQESNPALGLRGVRVSLKFRALFRAQIRALLRAATKGNLKIMFPMIASEWEVDEATAFVQEVSAELAKEGISHAVPPIGIMIETPAAAVMADRLAEKVAFFSIGSNDLTQYTLAIDREAEDMEQYFDPCHESVLRLIESVAEKAHKKGIPVGICGQLAANPKATDRFIACGIDELSVPIAKVCATRTLAAEAEKAKECAGFANNGGMEIAAFADGELIPMREIPDAAFSAGMLGPCVGILPENENVYAPCSGTVTAIAETKHAITVETAQKTQYLIHMGIDTVKLKGKPFTLFVEVGQSVRQGEHIASADLQSVRDAGCSPIIVTVKL